MRWIDIQLRVAVDRQDEANQVLLAIGDAVASGSGGRPWFMTSEHVNGDLSNALEATLRDFRSSARHPHAGRPPQARLSVPPNRT